jgi:hypothetical protein
MNDEQSINQRRRRLIVLTDDTSIAMISFASAMSGCRRSGGTIPVSTISSNQYSVSSSS